MRIHSNATTNLKQRRLFKSSSQSCRSLAKTCQVSPETVSKWRRREYPEDRSARPKTIHYAFSQEEEDFILSLRDKRLSLDDLFDTIGQVLPDVSRASLHRLLVRRGVNRLPRAGQDSKEPGRFKDYEPGYLHIDCFYLPRIDGKRRYCFVAVDRATRLVFLRIYEQKSQESAVAFLGRCLSFYPFMVRKILTDNGFEYTYDTFKNRWGSKTKEPHPFGEVCKAIGAEHRKTRPYTPKTNGLVERTNGLIQDGTTKRHTYRDATDMARDLYWWFIHYNFRRKHRQLGRRTPYEVTCEWYKNKPELFIKEPASLLLSIRWWDSTAKDKL